MLEVLAEDVLINSTRDLHVDGRLQRLSFVRLFITFDCVADVSKFTRTLYDLLVCLFCSHA
jgi:hypothetical protein